MDGGDTPLTRAQKRRRRRKEHLRLKELNDESARQHRLGKRASQLERKAKRIFKAGLDTAKEATKVEEELRKEKTDLFKSTKEEKEAIRDNATRVESRDLLEKSNVYAKAALRTATAAQSSKSSEIPVHKETIVDHKHKLYFKNK